MDPLRAKSFGVDRPTTAPLTEARGPAPSARTPGRVAPPSAGATKPTGWIEGSASNLATRTSGKSAIDVRAAAIGGSILPKWDLDALDRRIAELAKAEIDGSAKIEVTRMGAIDHTSLYALHLPSLGRGEPKLRVLVTGGVHGAEAAGPAAAMAIVDRLLAHPELRDGIEVTVVPLLNPVGYERHTRRNGDDVDLNRTCTDRPDVPREIALFREAIRGADFDLSIDLHASASVGRRGFFAIHDGSAELLVPTVADFAKRYEVVSESTELYAMDAPGIFKSQNQGTLKAYMKARGTKWAYTVEAPAKAPYEHQVRGLTDFVGAAIHHGAMLKSACGAGG